MQRPGPPIGATLPFAAAMPWHLGQQVFHPLLSSSSSPSSLAVKACPLCMQSFLSIPGVVDPSCLCLPTHLSRSLLTNLASCEGKVINFAIIELAMASAASSVRLATSRSLMPLSFDFNSEKSRLKVFYESECQPLAIR